MRAREGPFPTATIAHATVAEQRYEVASFIHPRPLSRTERRELLQRVTTGLAARPGAVLRGVRTLSLAGRLTVAPTLDLVGGRRGHARAL